MEVVTYNFPIISDNRGSLVALEQFKDLPFDVKRIYYIFDVKDNSRRGFHAHKKLQQVLISVSGSCKVKLDDGKQSEIITLDKPNKGLFVDKMVWREMFDFSEDCVLMVFASEHYDEADYFRSYEQFLEEI